MYTVYRRRWLIVFVASIINFTNAMLWLCFSPISNYTANYYRIDANQVDWLSEIYIVIYIPLSPIAIWLLDTVGIRSSIILAGWLNLIGSGLRSISTYDFLSVDHKYAVLLLGQCIAGCGQPFILFLSTKLAGQWFPDGQRTIANTLVSMANPLGVLIANVLSTNVVKKSEDLPVLLWICTALAGFGAALATFGVLSSRPPSPPSASAEEGTEPFFQGLKQLVKVKSFWILVMVFGCGLAVFTAVTTFLQQVLCARNYSNEFSGLCGALIIGAGIVGAGVFGAMADRWRCFEEITKMCFALSVLGGIMFTEVSRHRENGVYILAAVAWFGFFGFGTYPVCMELAVEVTYPVAEATSSGLLFLSAQVQSLVYMLIAQNFTYPLPVSERHLPNTCGSDDGTTASNLSAEDWTVPGLFLDGLMAFFAIALIVFFRPVYRRIILERMVKEGVLEQDAAVCRSHNSDSNPTAGDDSQRLLICDDCYPERVNLSHDTAMVE